MTTNKRCNKVMTCRGEWAMLAVIVCGAFALVAQAGTGPRNRGPAAFIWDADNGMRDLTDLLIDDYGIDLGGSILTSANGISADGTVMWGEKFPLGDDGAQYWKLTLDDGMGDYRPLVELPTSYGGVPFPHFTINAMSRDGKVFGGRVDDGRDTAFEAFTWSDETGVVRLGRLLDDAFSEVSALSFDGSVAVGRAGTPQFHAFRWSSETGMEDLGELFGGANFSWALAVSDDGSVVVGNSSSANSGTSTIRTEAFRWTQNTGMVGLGDLPGGNFDSEARVISGDGTLIGGVVSTGILLSNALYTDSEEWTEFDGRIHAISLNGEYIVGISGSSEVQGAFIWNELSGFIPLGDLPGGTTYSEAFGVSDDGAIAVGTVSVPEPAALTILALAGIPILWRSRMRKRL